MKISLSKRILSQAAAAALAVLFVFPIYWMIVTSLKPNASILRLPLEFWPGEFTGANYRAILSDGLFPIYYKNNLIVSLATTVLTLLIAIMAAYAFSRFPFRGSRALQMLFLSTQMFPAVVLLIALYSLYAKLGLINTYTALILACPTNALPMSIWILKGFFDTVSKSLEEAAYIDGASRGYSMVRIIVPLVTARHSGGRPVFLSDFLGGFSLGLKSGKSAGYAHTGFRHFVELFGRIYLRLGKGDGRHRQRGAACAGRLYLSAKIFNLRTDCRSD